MSKANKEGIFIVFEGIDGSGKSTVLDMTYKHLMQSDYDVLTLFEPTNGTWGSKIREISFKKRDSFDPKEELQFFIEDRKENIEKNIKPALKANKIVLQDRYYYSTIAYQSAAGIDKEYIENIHSTFVVEPDLVLIFDLDPEIALSRILENREGKTTDFEKLEYLKQVRNNYLEFKNKNFYYITAEQQLENVFNSVISVITNFLNNINFGGRQK